MCSGIDSLCPPPVFSFSLLLVLCEICSSLVGALYRLFYDNCSGGFLGVWVRGGRSNLTSLLYFHLFWFDIHPDGGQSTTERGAARCGSYCFLILRSQNTRFCSPCTDKSPTDFNGKFACIRDKRAGRKLCTMMQSDPPAVEIDVIAFSPSPLFSTLLPTNPR